MSYVSAIYSEGIRNILIYEKLSVKRDAFAVTIMHNEDIWFLL